MNGECIKEIKDRVSLESWKGDTHNRRNVIQNFESKRRGRKVDLKLKRGRSP